MRRPRAALLKLLAAGRSSFAVSLGIHFLVTGRLFGQSKGRSLILAFPIFYRAVIRKEAGLFPAFTTRKLHNLITAVSVNARYCDM